MHVTIERLLSVERPLAKYIKYYMIIICVVRISDNVIETGVFLLGSKYMEAENFSKCVTSQVTKGCCMNFHCHVGEKNKFSFLIFILCSVLVV